MIMHVLGKSKACVSHLSIKTKKREVKMKSLVETIDSSVVITRMVTSISPTSINP